LASSTRFDSPLRATVKAAATETSVRDSTPANATFCETCAVLLTTAPASGAGPRVRVWLTPPAAGPPVRTTASFPAPPSKRMGSSAPARATRPLAVSTVSVSSPPAPATSIPFTWASR
jgi:hypothetical protein